MGIPPVAWSLHGRIAPMDAFAVSGGVTSCKYSGQRQRHFRIYWYGGKLMNLCSKSIVTRNRFHDMRSMAWCSKCERQPCLFLPTLPKVSRGEARRTKHDS